MDCNRLGKQKQKLKCGKACTQDVLPVVIYTEYNVCGMVRKGHTYLYIWKDGEFKNVLRTLCRQVRDPELEFSLYDAVAMKGVMVELIRRGIQ